MQSPTERPRGSDPPELITAELRVSPQGGRLDDAHFKKLLDSAPVMIWGCDAHGGYTLFNEQWVTFTGLPRETLLYNPWLRDIHPEDYPLFRQQFLAAFQERADFRAEYRLRRADGRYRWLLDTGVPMYDDGGDFVGYSGACVDINDRKQMEDALAQSERKFKLLFDLSADAQMLLDGERVVDCNPASVAFFGTSDRWAIIGRSALEFFSQPVDEVVALSDKIHECLSRNTVRFEWNASRADAVELPVEVLLTSVPINGRTLLHAVVRDLTGRRELEMRLRQAEKMKAIGTLAGGIAHDFNNLLASIMGYTELALMDMNITTSTAAHMNLAEALTAARRARDLVRQILTFSRSEESRRVEVDLGRIIQESGRLLRASIPSTVDIRVRTEPGCVVIGNTTQLQQVLLNLGANAEHAMRAKGGGALEISLSRRMLDDPQRFPGVAPGPVVELVVRDTGTGMPDRVRDRMFDPFFTTKPVGEGTGMGLSVVHGIVSAHGGAIRVESEPGQGTVFSIVFPRVAGEGRLETGAHRVPSAHPPGRGRVLIIEDEVSIGRMFRRMLTRLGYESEFFENPLDALATFTRDPKAFDVVITDLTMPGMTGDELTRELLRVRPDIPVILATGYGPTLSAERVRELGIIAVLRKPLTIAELVEALRLAHPPRSLTPPAEGV